MEAVQWDGGSASRGRDGVVPWRRLLDERGKDGAWTEVRGTMRVEMQAAVLREGSGGVASPRRLLDGRGKGGTWTEVRGGMRVGMQATALNDVGEV
ncbi:hypothetical protein E2562_038460 [Oryza meyeriana var. granulata]|uniref:Uncharacterized protein n=1 Tax=Oryza meyeriana var. granulata TaxID=110450 RepID=A0A6G1EUA3_9ORYZ|nr:hypothetical protein E2562_038460 [Oryza meyeriana var. granulata]